MRCQSRGFENAAGMNFCGGCSVTPRHLAERILAEQAALEVRGAPDGERKTITVLFADIKGSKALLAALGEVDHDV